MGRSIRPPVPAVPDTRVERVGRYTGVWGARRGEVVLPGPIGPGTVPARTGAPVHVPARGGPIVPGGVRSGALRCGAVGWTGGLETATLRWSGEPPGESSGAGAHDVELRLRRFRRLEGPQACPAASASGPSGLRSSSSRPWTSCCRTTRSRTSCCPTSCCRTTRSPTSCCRTTRSRTSCCPTSCCRTRRIPDQLLPDHEEPVQMLPFHVPPDHELPVGFEERHRRRR